MIRDESALHPRSGLRGQETKYFKTNGTGILPKLQKIRKIEVAQCKSCQCIYRPNKLTADHCDQCRAWQAIYCNTRKNKKLLSSVFQQGGSNGN